MSAPVDAWLPPLAVGATFTAIGLAKVYGLARGIVGKKDEPLAKLCGT